MDPEASSGPAQAGIQDEVSVIVAEPAWRRLVPRAEAWRPAPRGRRVRRAPSCWPPTARCARLNARHRGRNKPTNVLTYTAPAPEMLLALGVVRREAAAAGRRPAHHLAHLVVHGALHLAGHDHHHPGDARRMELAEARILHRLRRAQPVEARMSSTATAHALAAGPAAPAARARQPEHSLRELIAELVQEAADEQLMAGEQPELDRQERALIANVLRLRETTADDVMVPRADIVAMRVDVTLEQALRADPHRGPLAAAGVSRAAR